MAFSTALRGLAVAVTVLAGAVAVAACGDSDETEPAADVAVVTTTTETTTPATTEPTTEAVTTEPTDEIEATPEETAGDFAISLPGTLRTDAVDQLVQDQGQARWMSSAENRLDHATWDFDDGDFTFDTVDVRTDVYPLTGSYEVDGATVSFAADGATASANGSASARISGTLDLETGELDFEWAASSGLAAQINGTGFSSANGSAYHGRVRVS